MSNFLKCHFPSGYKRKCFSTVSISLLTVNYHDFPGKGNGMFSCCFLHGSKLKIVHVRLKGNAFPKSDGANWMQVSNRGFEINSWIPSSSPIISTIPTYPFFFYVSHFFRNSVSKVPSKHHFSQYFTFDYPHLPSMNISSLGRLLTAFLCSPSLAVSIEYQFF